MTTKVVTRYDSDSPVSRRLTRWNYFWGLKQPVDVQPEAPCASICQVKAKTNFGQILISAVSLGIAVPMTIEYDCCPTEPEPEVLGNTEN